MGARVMASKCETEVRGAISRRHQKNLAFYEDHSWGLENTTPQLIQQSSLVQDIRLNAPPTWTMFFLSESNNASYVCISFISLQRLVINKVLLKKLCSCSKIIFASISSIYFFRIFLTRGFLFLCNSTISELSSEPWDPHDS